MPMALDTVAHGRDGAAEWGLVLADVAAGVRAYGRVEDPALLAAMEAEEWVGRAVPRREAPAGVTLVTA
jgi:acetyl-CoA C-acetyltransferase